MSYFATRGDGKPRCQELVYKRDTYRYSGRGTSGFTMHYSREQCTREVLPGKDKCWQHDEESQRERLERRRTT